MKCLNCDREMVICVHRGVEFDECPGCDAHWFDQGEVTQIFSQMGLRFDEGALRQGIKLPNNCRWCETSNPDGAVRCKHCEHVLGHSCPRDGRAMFHTRFGDIEIDLCPACSGLWFDGEEFRAMLGAAQARVAAAAPKAPASGPVGGGGAPQDRAARSGKLRPARSVSYAAAPAQPRKQEAPAQAAPVGESGLTPSGVAPCQICGKVPDNGALQWEHGFWKCITCFGPEDPGEAERMERLRQRNARHWQEQIARERMATRLTQDGGFTTMGAGEGLLTGLGAWLVDGD